MAATTLAITGGLAALILGGIAAEESGKINWDQMGKNFENNMKHIGKEITESTKKGWNYWKEKVQNGIIDTPKGNDIPEIKDEEGNTTENPDFTETTTSGGSDNGSGDEMPEPPQPQNNLNISKPGAMAGIGNGINNAIQDTTNQNIENQINNTTEDYIAKIEEWQKKQWEREDTAYQRMVKDMQLAGINPNLYNATPVSTSTSTITTGLTEELTIIANKLEEMIQRNFEGSENDKDRLVQGIGTLTMIALMMSKAK